MPADDLPAWMRWAIALAQVVGPFATIALAVIAVRTAKAALASAELARTEFALSRIPVVLVQDLQVRYTGRRLTARGAIAVATEGMSPAEKVGRRVVCHRADTSIEAWVEDDDEMQVVCRRQQTLAGSRHLYDSRQPILVTDRAWPPPTTVSIRVIYTFSSAYAPWYAETWVATATADADDTGQFVVGPISHQFLRSRQHRNSYRWRLADCWLRYRQRMEQIRREMGG